ncbi:hypothetical protein Cni_G04277 [Canna indica]|uniref:Pentatricopeptide repeat-containing protein n=1 Tax=Canna indica TaxID=4628 RepID=A0AAQ3JWM8_9LILI|nr:hypothetical protein Cni_G04277 [Canna indica]
MLRRILFRLPTRASLSTISHRILASPSPSSSHLSKSFPLSSPFKSFSSSSRTSPILYPDDNDDCIHHDDDFPEAAEPPEKLDDELLRDVDSIVSSLHDFAADSAAAKLRLEQCDASASPELVSAVLSRLRNDWAAAFTFFLWAGTQPGYSHSIRQYHAMISILGKMRRFETAWSLVHEMRSSARGPSLLTPQTILILIRRYCAVHDVGRAINAFYVLKRFGFTPGIEDFHGLLSALCRYKNVEDAEHLLLCNEKTFPFETKSFNIVLNGWCNVLVRVGEAKRFWRDM